MHSSQPQTVSYVWQRALSRLLLSAMGLGLVGCSSVDWGWLLASPDRPTSIQRIHERSRDDYTVYIRGRVNERASLIDAQLYQLEDYTGEIWVLSPGPAVQPGESLLIRGKVRFESIPIAEQERGGFYIEELEQTKRGESVWAAP
jgi:hypothetical protein